VDALSAADREVVDRLFNAAWREGFASEKRLSPSLGGEGPWAHVKLPGGAELVCGAAAVGALDWVRTRAPYYVRTGAGAELEPVSSASQVAQLWDDGTPGAERFVAEVEESARNLGSFLDALPRRAAALGRGGPGLLAQAHGGAAEAEGVPPEAWLEGWILRGHPFHPGCKTRAGFDAEDVRRYSPEFGRVVRARFVAVRRDRVVERRAAGAAEDWPQSWSDGLDAELFRRGLPRRSYVPLPVHPWQAERVLPRVFAHEIAAGLVVLLDFTAEVRPLVSLRTFVPVGEPGACQLKVPVAVQATSAQRTVSAPSAENGPYFSDWVAAARRTLPWAQGWELQAEERGVHWWDPGAAPTDAAALERARHLSFLCRRPSAAVAGAWTVPAALLAEPSPVDGDPVVAELLALHAGGPGAFFHDYAALTLRAVLPLALAEGIALEAHAQNTLVRFRDGAPESVVLRDLGGLRVHPEWAGPAKPAGGLHPGTLIVAKTPAELVNKIHHTWLQNHLAPLARAVAACSGVPEASLWAAARAAARAAFAGLGGRAPRERVEAFAAAFFAPTVKVKALTRMRLAGKYFQYDLAELPNPLYEG
jgi:siderophore synthetase component